MCDFNLTSSGEGASLALVGHHSSNGITVKYLTGWMFCYILQLHTPSFPIRLVKTKSDFIVGSVETGLGKKNAGGCCDDASVDAYPFLAFSDLNCHPEDTGICVFWLHCAAW